MVDGQGDDVLLRDAVPAQLPDELAGVAAGHLEDGETAHVGEEGVAHGGREVGQLGQALGGEHEGSPVLAELGEHRLVVHARQGLHLVHDDERPAALVQGQAFLLADDAVDEVQQRCAHQGGYVASGSPLGGGDQQDAAVEDGAAKVDGGAGLAQDGPRPFRGGVVGEPRLHGRDRVGLVLAPPAPEVPRPPVEQVAVGDALEHVAAEALVGEQAQAVENGVLVVGGDGWMGVRLVQGLGRVLEDGLHARSPLIPEPPRHADDRVGGPVAVAEDAGVEEVDAGEALLRGEVHEPHLVGERRRHVPEDLSDEVGVGIDDDDGVPVAPRGLLAHLVGDEVAHEGGFAHARAGHVEVVAAEEVVGKADLPGRRGDGVAHVGASRGAPRRGKQHLRAGTGHEGCLVACSGRVPEGGDLAHAEDAASAEEAGSGGRQL